jgi:hypothetical protein
MAPPTRTMRSRMLTNPKPLPSRDAPMLEKSNPTPWSVTTMHI